MFVKQAFHTVEIQWNAGMCYRYNNIVYNTEAKIQRVQAEGMNEKWRVFKMRQEDDTTYLFEIVEGV